jgi:sugar O-acyltransferase (sialic acid O-acetyltransferase NeuD family)
MRRLVIYGAAFVDVLKLLRALNERTPTYEVLGFLDDTPELRGTSRLGVPVLGGQERLAELARDEGIEFFNNVRGRWQHCELIAGRLRAVGRQSVSLVHPSVDQAYVRIGQGVTVGDGCTIAAMSSLDDYVTVRLGCTISHDATIGAFASLGPGLVVGSHVSVGARAAIGAGATLITGTTVGEEAVVGAGSVVNRAVEPGTTVAGVPARRVASAG